MRIQDKFDTLANFWSVLAGILAILCILALCMTTAAFIRGKTLQDQCEVMRKENDALNAIRGEMVNREKQLNLGNEQLSTILDVVLAACKTSNAALGEISVGERAERDGYSALPLEVSIKGNYNQIGKFINTIERKDLRFRFDKLELSTKETKGIGIIGKIEGYFMVLDFPGGAGVTETKK